ncbi:MAG: TRAP transporter large permease subunit [Treponema sp.]|nr:TRAP transporter large permease subunit [Treponema sp.]
MDFKILRTFKISWLEKGICFLSLSLLALIPIIELVLRQFHSTIPDSKAIIIHIFLVAGFFAAMHTTKSGEHISITAVQYLKNDKAKQLLATAGTLVSIFLLTILAWNCVSFIKYGLLGRLIGPVPNRVFAAAMPLGYAVMAVRFCLKLDGRRRPIAFLALLAGTVAALPAIAKVIWGFDPPEPFFTWVNILYDAAWLFHIPAIVFLIISALSGMPIFAAIGGIAMIVLQSAGREPDAAPIQIFSALTDMDIIAIPLFTLTGFFLSESKAGERLVKTFKAFFGWLPGGMVIATVIICAFFTSFTGASGVTILALGGILYIILNENKYTEKFSLGLLTSSGGIGLLFPPSLPIILVASTSNTILHFMNIPIKYNIIHYFVGAIVPGIILVAAMIITGIVLSSKVKLQTEAFSSKEVLSSLKESFLEILLPVILITGYFSGRLTLVEASALSVIYVVVVEVFVNKDIAVSDIPKVFFKAVPIIGGILAILAMAKALSYAFVDSGVPENFVFWMQNAVKSKFVFLLLLNLALLVLGCLMDIFSAILVFLPLIVPLGHAYGIDPVHLGIIFIVNLEAGFITPPVGMNLFLASYRFERPFMQICRSILPFLNVRFAVILLVTYVPWLSTFLLGLIN